MLCQRCGTYVSEEALTCERCGTLLSENRNRMQDTGVRALRQGRLEAAPPTISDMPRGDIPEYGDYEMSPLPLEREHSPRRKIAPVAPAGTDTFAGLPARGRRDRPVQPQGRDTHFQARVVLPRSRRKSHTNWMLISVICAGIAIAALAGYLIYMSGTDKGQRMTARGKMADVTAELLELARSKDDLRQTAREEVLKDLGKAPAQAYWLVGGEYMDVGDVETAIRAFTVADTLDPENYDGLLLLANAYELYADDTTAEEIYLRLSKDIALSRGEAYTAMINMYLDQRRNPEAADMMRVAYENTDHENYRLQRKNFIPLTPQVDLAAGRYMLDQKITLTSPQNYDIYYTLNNEVEAPVLGRIPAGWRFAESGEMIIPEGTLTLRAFCVSENLTSDLLSVTYTVYYPTPSAPYANLAPKTYTRPLTVSLRPGSDDDVKEHKDNPLTFYYTIDGSLPTVDSPIFDGTPIKLPSGRVTIRAICVNQYGKVSSTREVEYKFDYAPHPLKIYSEEDRFQGFALHNSSIEDFKANFGQPTSETETKYLHLDYDARHLEYDWGYAVFMLSGGRWGLVRIEMNREMTGGPRGVGFGSSEEDIVSVYKDMGQLKAPNGNRGLYYADPDIGSVIQNADGTKTVQYSCSTIDSKVSILQYHLRDNRVYQIVHYYRP